MALFLARSNIVMFPIASVEESRRCEVMQLSRGLQTCHLSRADYNDHWACLEKFLDCHPNDDWDFV